MTQSTLKAHNFKKELRDILEFEIYRAQIHVH